MNIEKILSLLNGVRKTGHNKWVARCPVHTEKTPSFAISIGRTGNVVCHCFGCGAGMPEVMATLGITWDDIFQESNYNAQKSKREYAQQYSSKQVLDCLAWECTALASLLTRLKGTALAEDEKCTIVDKMLESESDYGRIMLACERIIDAQRYIE